jgi:hypothetical protein
MTDSTPSILYQTNKFSALDSDSDQEEKSSKTNVTNVVKNIEENMFKQYYTKKNNLKSNKTKFGNTNNEGFTTINLVKKKEKVIMECKEIDIDENLFDNDLPSSYRVLAHHNDDKNWDYLSYHNITTMSKWRELGQFFNTLNTISGECKYTDFDIFIMKNEISPMWEDIENRNGSICSIKIDSITDGYELLRNLSYHMVNNTLLKFTPNLWDIVNGLSFSPKKIDNYNLDSFCVIIKIWFKVNILNYGNIDKLFNDNIAESINRYSIKVKSIKPEY